MIYTEEILLILLIAYLVCGKKEDVYHFLFVCKLFSNARNTLFNEPFQIQNLGIIDSHTLLWGNDNLDYKTNVISFDKISLKNYHFCAELYNQFSQIHISKLFCSLPFFSIYVYIHVPCFMTIANYL